MEIKQEIGITDDDIKVVRIWVAFKTSELSDQQHWNKNVENNSYPLQHFPFDSRHISSEMDTLHLHSISYIMLATLQEIWSRTSKVIVFPCPELDEHLENCVWYSTFQEDSMGDRAGPSSSMASTQSPQAAAAAAAATALG